MAGQSIFSRQSDRDTRMMAGNSMFSGGGEWRPQGLMDALSEVEQFYLIEHKGQDIPEEFLTMVGTFTFFSTGMRVGFLESFCVFLLAPMFYCWLIPFKLHNLGGLGLWVMRMIPFMLVLTHTILSCYGARLCIGTTTRKIVKYLFVGRMLVVCFAGVVFYGVCYLIAYPTILTPDRIWKLANHLPAGMREDFYRGVEITVLPSIMSMAAICVLIMIVAAILPYVLANVRYHRLQYKKARNQAMTDGL